MKIQNLLFDKRNGVSDFNFAIWLILFVALSGGLQLWASVPWDADTSYHIAVARLIREYGILHKFPWTRFSWLNENYADKEFLFHLLLACFSDLPWIIVSKIAGTLLGTFLLVTIYMILRAEKVKYAGIWTLLTLSVSGHFIMRFSHVRPHVLAISLALIVTWAAARRKYLILVVVSFLYPLCYVAWHSALILVALVELGSFMSRKGVEWRNFAVVTLGLTAGLLIHPNFPEILTFFWIQNFQILFETAWANREGFELGYEFLPYDMKGLAMYATLPFTLCVVASIFSWRRKLTDFVPLSFSLVALSFAAMTWGSQRFIEYFVPFSVVAIALALKEYAGKWLSLKILSTSVIFTAIFASESVLLLHRRLNDFPEPLVKELQSVVPRDARIFTCNWLTTGEMMISLPGRRFMVALDPVLFWRKDPELYKLWFNMVRSPSKSHADIIRTRFDSDFVLCEAALPEWYPFVDSLAEDPSVKVLVNHPYWLLFDLRNS